MLDRATEEPCRYIDAPTRTPFPIADLGLPDGSGYDLARFATGLTRPPACIALSAHDGHDAVDESRRVGFRLHLGKPCDPALLARVAEQLCAR